MTKRSQPESIVTTHEAVEEKGEMMKIPETLPIPFPTESDSIVFYLLYLQETAIREGKGENEPESST